MDLRNKVLEKHSKENMQEIAQWVGQDPARYRELIHLFLYDTYRVTQRTSWALLHVHHLHPEMIQPYLKEAVENMRKPNIHDSIKRNTVRIFQDIDLPEELWGDILDTCFGWLADPKEAVAIRAFSMNVLWKICQQVPELIPELKITIEDHIEYGTSGFKNRGGKILKEILLLEKRG